MDIQYHRPRRGGVGNDTMRGFRSGIIATGSLAVGSLLLGVLFGSTATAAGLTALQALIMSTWVFAGGVQFAALSVWQEPLPLIAIAVSTALISSRHILMGLTLAPRLAAAGARPPLTALFFLTDVNWVLTLKRDGRGPTLAFFLGSGCLMFSGWVLGTALGLALPGVLDPVTAGSLASGGAVFFAILMVILAKGHSGPRSPWLLSGLVAAAAGQVVSPHLALVAAVAAGALWGLVLAGRNVPGQRDD